MRNMNPFATLWRPEPAPPGFAKGDLQTPEQSSSILSRLVFHWITPMLYVGYTRPLQVADLWALPERHHAHTMADCLGKQFYSRCPEHSKPVFFRKESLGPNVQTPGGLKETSSDESIDVEKTVDGSSGGGEGSHLSPITIAPLINASADQTPSTKCSPSRWFRNPFKRDRMRNMKNTYSRPNYGRVLFRALHATFLWRWWLAGMLKLIGDILQMTMPLINRALLMWLTESFIYHSSGANSKHAAPRGVGYGIGLAVALFGMQEMASLAHNQFQILVISNGVAIRTGVISLVFRKSLRLSGRARLQHSSGEIITHISTDVTRLEAASVLIHNLWINPIEIAIGVGLLIGNLGVSALVGLGILLIGFPIQAFLVLVIFKQRKKGVKITDQRMRIITEVLQGIRLIKSYAWETFYARKIGALREAEVKTIRASSLAIAALISFATSMPILASVLSFITYSLTGHSLHPAIIFSSLQFLNLIRTPLIIFPFVLSACSDAYVALGRIGTFLTAEELGEPFTIEPDSKFGVQVDGDFTWEAGAANSNDGPEAACQNGVHTENTRDDLLGKKQLAVLPTTMLLNGETGAEEDKPFELQGMKLKVPKGAFIAIIGSIGSGKSSLLQAMIGEMRKTRGKVVFGGNVAYVSQTAWIMNTTLKQNILFGRKEDEAKYQEVVKACSLTQDLKMLSHGDMTEIGEKGVNLSEGQKARVSLARAAYAESDVVLLDDPLSPVDAHMGNHILEHCLLQGPLADKTRILVTHAVPVLKHADYVYLMENGVIAEEGEYQDLVENGQAFSHLVQGFGNQTKLMEDSDNLETSKDNDGAQVEPRDSESRAPLMEKEERNTGRVRAVIYKKYMKAAGGLSWFPFLILLLTLSYAAQVGSTLFLSFWTAGSIPGFRQEDYIIVYALLGVAQGIFSFAESFAFSLAGLRAALRLFKMALHGVFRSPISFYDTTPMGRILSRLSQDQYLIDNQLSLMIYDLFATGFAVLGTVAMVFYTFPLMAVIFAPLTVLYWACAMFYRRSSVEVKRLDSLLRSALYASYSESLTGLSTVRAYRDQARFIATSEKALDVENRAFFMTMAMQLWLNVRLDLLGNVLLLGIALFAVGSRNTVNPSKIGVVLSYTLSLTQVFSQIITVFAQTEQAMNSVERVTVYAELPTEGDSTTRNDPPPSWPQKGAITFRDVSLTYREGLPLVLKNVNFEIKAGEKVGIVGRTGTGKSSLLQALFRIVELKQGSITIDDVNCRAIGLDTLRRKLAVIHPSSVLFLGTLRDNLDPERSRTDAELISALRKSWLLPQVGIVDQAAEAKFSLDSSVGGEGSNFSAGERQLLALCRVLIKNSKIIVLDEATSNVDIATDSKIQRTIQAEFSSSTLLCIAYRLSTILHYDRVLVMDAGQVAEFDTPLNLFDRSDSIFRSLCNEASVSREDIIKIPRNVTKAALDSAHKP